MDEPKVLLLDQGFYWVPKFGGCQWSCCCNSRFDMITKLEKLICTSNAVIDTEDMEAGRNSGLESAQQHFGGYQ